MTSKFKGELRSGELRRIFRSGSDNPLYSHLVRLTVLYQDLRIESLGIAQEAELHPLDELHANYRRGYFIRRHVSTLFEFGSSLRGLNELRPFRAVRSAFGQRDKATWEEAVGFFKSTEQHSLLKSVRNDVGGHFLLAAAEHAARELPDIEGQIEIAVSQEGRKSFRLHFAEDLVFTAVLRRVEAPGPVERLSRLIQMLGWAMVHANNAMTILTKILLWPEFKEERARLT